MARAAAGAFSSPQIALELPWTATGAPQELWWRADSPLVRVGARLQAHRVHPWQRYEWQVATGGTHLRKVLVLPPPSRLLRYPRYLELVT